MLKQTVYIGHVEIAGHYQIAASPVVLPDHGVAFFDAVFAVCSISEVAEPKLSAPIHMVSEPLFVFEMGPVGCLSLAEFFPYFLKQPYKRIGFYSPEPMYIGLSGRHIEFDICNSGSILTPVVLLLHQKIQLLGCPHGASVSIDKVLKGFF
jgi:hypothetical protein